MVRFVSEFGAQAVPASADFMQPERWPDLDWELLEERHALQKNVMDKRVPPADYGTFDAWRTATQLYQGRLLKHQIETLRRLKYRPTGGFCVFSFADGHPAVSWSILDHHRIPKLGYAAVVEACLPVIVIADRFPASVSAGQAIALDVHVVNDRRVPLEGAFVAAALRWSGGEHHWRFVGDVGADGCVRVGTLQIVVPKAPGQLQLDLTLEHPDVAATNRYTTLIAAPA
jgi:beta-mannosidase